MITIVYDGECPFCANYVRLARLRERVGEVKLVDAREHPALVADYAARGYEIDESFIVKAEGKTLTKGAALAYINGKLAPKWTGLPLLTSPQLLERLYPALRAGRNLALRVLGRKPLRPPQQ